MPFVNDSGDDQVEYLSDGMTETLISSLSTLPNVSVKARSTVFFYKGKAVSPKQLGKDLNVEAVLLGKVSGRGDDLRLNLELVNTETEDVIWSETYDRKQSDLVALQSEVAREVSSKILEKLSGDQEQRVSEMGTTDPKAYQAYLKGRFYWNQRGKVNLKRAIDEFKFATNIDPKYALAYAAMGETYAILAGYSGERREDTFPQARENAERAIALNDRLASPQAALGLIEQQSWNWKLAEEHFRKAIELDSNYPSAYHWYSILLKSVGRLDEAAEMINRAKELDPLSSIIGSNVSETLLLQGKPQASIDNSLKIIELTPNFPQAYSNLGFAYLKTGNPEKAVSEFEKAASFEDDSYQTACLGYAYGIAGNRTEAEKILVALKKDHSAGKTSEKDVAVVLLGIGEKDKAIDWLEKSFEARNPLLKNISWEFPFESLHSDPRFNSLLKRMGLPDNLVTRTED